MAVKAVRDERHSRSYELRIMLYAKGKSVKFCHRPGPSREGNEGEGKLPRAPQCRRGPAIPRGWGSLQGAPWVTVVPLGPKLALNWSATAFYPLRVGVPVSTGRVDGLSKRPINMDVTLDIRVDRPRSWATFLTLVNTTSQDGSVGSCSRAVWTCVRKHGPQHCQL